MSKNQLWPVEQLLDWIHRLKSPQSLNIKSTELSTIIAILKFADNSTWKSHPSIQSIANVSLKDKKSVEDTIKRLVEKNILKITIRYTKDGDRDSNEYQFIVDNLFKVGAFSPLPWGLIRPYGRGKFAPLTTKETTYKHKKKENHFLEKSQNQKPAYQDLSQYQTAPTADKAAQILQEFIRGEIKSGKKTIKT